jgi:hypothetical protein
VEDDEDDDLAPVKKSTKKAPVVEEDDEDEDEEPVAPVRKKKEKPAPVKKSKNPPVVEDDEEDEDDEVTWDSISELKVKDLKTLCKTKDLDTDPEDYDDDIKSFRKAVAKELGIKVPEAAPEKEKSENKCPSGFRFGVDTDKKDKCNACDLWDDCMESKKKNKK